MLNLRIEYKHKVQCSSIITAIENLLVAFWHQGINTTNSISEIIRGDIATVCSQYPDDLEYSCLQSQLLELEYIPGDHSSQTTVTDIINQVGKSIQKCMISQVCQFSRNL